MPYIFEYYEEDEVRVYAELKKEFCDSKSKVPEFQQVLQGLEQKYDNKFNPDPNDYINYKDIIENRPAYAEKEKYKEYHHELQMKKELEERLKREAEEAKRKLEEEQKKKDDSMGSDESIKEEVKGKSKKKKKDEEEKRKKEEEKKRKEEEEKKKKEEEEKKKK